MNIRGATSTDGTNFWVTGQNPSLGLVYFNSALGTTNLLSTNNCRTVKIVSNQLYVVSVSATPGSGIFAVSRSSDQRHPDLELGDHEWHAQFQSV